MKIKSLLGIFGVAGGGGGKRGATQGPAGETADMVKFLLRHVGEDDALTVCGRLRDLQLPVPDLHSMFLASEGVIIFCEDYGVVVRVESRKASGIDTPFDRINDHPLVLQPLATINAGKNAVIEICPGVVQASREDFEVDLCEVLKRDGIGYFDMQMANTGLLPFKTAQFPNGIPIVIDRLSVERLSDATGDVAQTLRSFGLSRDPQEQLYGELRTRFAQAWPQGADKPDAAAIKDFWALCRAKKDEGALVAGWSTAQDHAGIKRFYKRKQAQKAALAYAEKLAGFGS